MHTGQIGFRLPKDHLPWPTLEGDLLKKGYMILNWPQGVVCDRDKGISGLSAEDTDKLHNVLSVMNVSFGLFDGVRVSSCAYISPPLKSCSTRSQNPRRNNGADLQANMLALERQCESDQIDHHPSILIACKQPRFRVTTAEAYPHKR